MTIEENKSMKEYTTFRIGGPARFFCTVRHEDEFMQALEYALEKGVPIFILGGGSNILVSDTGFAGLVIKMEIKGIRFTDDTHGNARVTAHAGDDWDHLVDETVRSGLYGLENLSLIPGSVGAAPVQNIGAYGSEVKDTIDHVRVYDREKKEFITILNYDCHFGYRTSAFKDNPYRYIIISVTFILKKLGKVNIEYRDLREYFVKIGQLQPTIAEVRKAVISIRTAKLPDIAKIGTAGSFFKNPVISHSQAHELKVKYTDIPLYPINEEYVKVSLAWIIDKVCGYRGVTRGEVGTYRNQALVIVNNGNATAREVIAFAEELKNSIKEKTNIVAEFEVQII